jgi:hypothetical protein
MFCTVFRSIVFVGVFAGTVQFGSQAFAYGEATAVVEPVTSPVALTARRGFLLQKTPVAAPPPTVAYRVAPAGTPVRPGVAKYLSRRGVNVVATPAISVAAPFPAFAVAAPAPTPIAIAAPAPAPVPIAIAVPVPVPAPIAVPSPAPVAIAAPAPVPVYVAPAPVCNPCRMVSRVSYVPETRYRTESVRVPVTCCRPVTTCDPCTGCCTTCMRPETTFVCRQRCVPYTVYRPVVTCQQVCPAPCQTCPTGVAVPTTGYSLPPAMMAPSLAPAPVAAPGCSSCTSAVQKASGDALAAYEHSGRLEIELSDEVELKQDAELQNTSVTTDSFEPEHEDVEGPISVTFSDVSFRRSDRRIDESGWE